NTRVSPNEPEEKITVIFTEDMYNAWLQRYKELGEGRGESDGPVDLPFEINFELTEKNIDRIDYDYLNNNFERCIRSREDADVKAHIRTKNAPRRFCATASAAQHVYATLVNTDLENGVLPVEANESFIDYIRDSRESSQRKETTNVLHAVGLDEAALR